MVGSAVDTIVESSACQQHHQHQGSEDRPDPSLRLRD
jgi:hypothetical protein